MKLSKVTVALVVAILAVMFLATSASALTNLGLKDYLVGSHKVLGTDYQLSEQQKKDVSSYLENNPVSDADAEKIKAEVEAAIKEVNATKAKDLDSVPGDVKSKALSKIQAAGDIAGVNITVNSKDDTVVVTNKKTGKVVSSVNGKKAIVKSSDAVKAASGSTATTGSAAPAGTSTVSQFAKTGNTFSVFAVVALIAVVAVSTIFVKKVNEK